jgi:membrane fusion protein, multidrug efflux system
MDISNAGSDEGKRGMSTRCSPIAVACVAAALALGCRRGGGRDPAAAPPPVTLEPENVAIVAQETLQSGPQVSGTLRARRAASIRAEVGGTVLEVAVEAGQKVKAGQVLARVEAAALRDAVTAANSGVAAARNGVSVAESNLRRARMLSDAGAIAAQQAEQTEASLEGARAQLADAQARLASARQQASRTVVRAPFSGVVSERQVSTGDVVAPGTALFTVIDPSRLQLEAAIPAALVAEVRPGTRVDFTVTGFERPFQGDIERINPAVDPGTGQVRIYVDVPNDDGRLVSGLYAQGRAATRRANALAVPASAVDTTTTPATVMRVSDGKVEKVAVETGLRDEVAGRVGIASGVRAGDVLVLASARASLADGAAVKLAERAAPASGPRKESN